MRQRTSLTALAVVMLLAGCGDDSEPSRTRPPAKTAVTTATTTSAAEPPTIADAKAFTRTLIPGYRSELRAKGAQEFGKTKIDCAATGGPTTECSIEFRYRRLDKCAAASGTVFVEDSGGKLQLAEGSGDLDVVEQICYIGPNGEPVPDNPNE